jgi:hypothetical protein
MVPVKILLKIIVLVGLLLSLTAAISSAPVEVGRFAPAVLQSAGNPNVKVWVNTNSGVYHCAGTRWYGNTKSGEYMTQKEAQSKGYRPAYGSICG